MPDELPAAPTEPDFDIITEVAGLPAELPPSQPREFETVRAALRLVRSRLHGQQVFFYPTAGDLSASPFVDLEPLTRFSHICKTFLFVVESVGSSFVHQPETLIELVRKDRPDLPIRLAQVHATKSPSALGWGLTKLWKYSTHGVEPASAVETKAWHLVVDRRVGNVLRELNLVILALSGQLDPIRRAALVYNRLFNFAGAAPYVLCLKPCRFGDQVPWERWDDEFARVICRGHHHPELVVREDRRDGEGPAAPWTELWQIHHGWGEARSYRRHAELPHHAPDNGEEAGFRGVLPGDGAYDDWELSFGEFAARRDLRTITITSRRPDGELLQTDPGGSTRSLLETLQQLERRCRRAGSNSLAIHLAGFEDQGPELTAWRMCSDSAFKLTVFVDSLGAWKSFAPYATHHEFE